MTDNTVARTVTAATRRLLLGTRLPHCNFTVPTPAIKGSSKPRE
jgi:hypothetical protein